MRGYRRPAERHGCNNLGTVKNLDIKRQGEFEGAQILSLLSVFSYLANRRIANAGLG
jgi:hypothetical protein